MKTILALLPIILGIASAYDATVPVTQWTGCAFGQVSTSCYECYGICDNLGGAYVDHPGNICPVSDTACPTEP